MDLPPVQSGVDSSDEGPLDTVFRVSLQEGAQLFGMLFDLVRERRDGFLRRS
jgi:hypothetical protein